MKAGKGIDYTTSSAADILALCHSSSLSWLMDFSQFFPVTSAFSGVIGAVFLSILLEFLFYRFSLISRSRGD
jgi:hypothetical protein